MIDDKLINLNNQLFDFSQIEFLFTGDFELEYFKLENSLINFSCDLIFENTNEDNINGKYICGKKSSKNKYVSILYENMNKKDLINKLNNILIDKLKNGYELQSVYYNSDCVFRIE